MAKIIGELKYTKTHEWIKIEGDEALIGITDYAQTHLGSIVFVDLPAVGNVFAKDASFGAVESVKAASDLYLPVSGKIVAVNTALEDSPNLLNDDCYTNYIVKIKIQDKAELTSLLDAAAYQQICEKK